MIGTIVTDKDGEPVDNNGNKLAPSSYQPSDSVKKLFAQAQKDYQTAYTLQHRAFDEFDGISLLDRARLDQETFAAFVGAQFVPEHKRWKFRGRKNTSRNKLIGILAHVLAGILYPFVYAKNEMNEEDKMTARVMAILIKDHLRKAGYEIKFLFLACSALVNPAVFCEVEYLEVVQKIKEKGKDGKVNIIEAVDDILSGLALNTLPIDEIMLPDFYSGTGSLQNLPCIIRVRRISYDLARGIYSGKHFDEDGNDLFDYVQAGRTKIVISNMDGNQTLFDVEWTESDRDFVQVLTFKYRPEDLEVTYVGGVFMGNEDDIYNNNPFEHRRMIIGKDGKWHSMPVYNVAMSGFEPLDPAGRFAYYKSGAFKEYWDDQSVNFMNKMLHDGTSLDVIKPVFLSGVASIDGAVMVPGATVPMPADARVTPYSGSPNLKAAFDIINQGNQDLSESTQDKSQSGIAQPGVTAYATAKAEQNAKIFLGVFGLMLSDLITKIGELSMDCVIQYATVGELDATVPEALAMKYKTFLAKGKDNGKNVTHKVIFTDKHIGRTYTPEQKTKLEWGLFNKTGGLNSDQRIYEVNPIAFARTFYTMYVDADTIVMKSVGADRQEKLLAFQMMSDPRVLPFTDPKAVADDFVIDEFGGDDPDKYKNKQMGNDPAMMNQVLSQLMNPGQAGKPAQGQPSNVNTNNSGVVVPQPVGR